MKKFRPSFSEYTIPVAQCRAVASKMAAMRVFFKRGISAEIALMQVTNRKGIQRIHWVAYNEEKIVDVLALFHDEEDFALAEIANIRPLTEHDVFCYDGSFYQMYCQKDNMEIRTFTTFVREDLVRKACQACGWEVATVKLAKICKEDGKTISVCWLIDSTHSGYDFHVMFVDLRDGLNISSETLKTAEYKPLNLNESFLAYDAYYTLQQNKQGRYVLMKSKNKPSLS
jgi:hypothetical protein